MAGLIDDAITAIKADLDIDDLSNFTLTEGQQNQFLEAMEVQTKLLPLVRSYPMERSVEQINSIQFYGRVTHAGAASDGSVRTILDADAATPSTEQNKLIAKEFVASMGIQDRLLRRVIGQNQTGNQILNLLGNAAGRDREEMIIFANSDIDYTDDDVLSQSDGFAVTAGNKLFGVGGSKDFDPAAKQFPFTLFDAMIEALPDRYLDGLDNYAFLIDWPVFNAALDLWGLRNTVMGDQALSTGVLPAYKGIKPIYIPLLNRAQSTEAKITAGHTGRIAMLQNMLNLNVGTFFEMTLEPKRVPEARSSKWYLSYESDQQYQEKNGGVTAFIERASI